MVRSLCFGGINHREKKGQLDGIHILLRWTVNYLEREVWGRIKHPVNPGHTWHIIVTKRMKKLELSKSNVSTIFQNDMSFQNLSKFEGGKKKLKTSSITQKWKQGDYRYFVFVLLLTLSSLPKSSLGVESKQHFYNFFHVTTLSLCTFSLEDKF